MVDSKVSLCLRKRNVDLNSVLGTFFWFVPGDWVIAFILRVFDLFLIPKVYLRLFTNGGMRHSAEGILSQRHCRAISFSE